MKDFKLNINFQFDVQELSLTNLYPISQGCTELITSKTSQLFPPTYFLFISLSSTLWFPLQLYLQLTPSTTYSLYFSPFYCIDELLVVYHCITAPNSPCPQGGNEERIVGSYHKSPRLPHVVVTPSNSSKPPKLPYHSFYNHRLRPVQQSIHDSQSCRALTLVYPYIH